MQQCGILYSCFWAKLWTCWKWLWFCLWSKSAPLMILTPFPWTGVLSQTLHNRCLFNQGLHCLEGDQKYLHNRSVYKSKKSSKLKLEQEQLLVNLLIFNSSQSMKSDHYYLWKKCSYCYQSVTICVCDFLLRLFIFNCLMVGRIIFMYI